MRVLGEFLQEMSYFLFSAAVSAALRIDPAWRLVWPRRRLEIRPDGSPAQQTVEVERREPHSRSTV
jgi:hypothetical protein